MLAKTIEEVKKDFIKEGIQLGIQKGIQKGMQKGIQQGIIDGKKATARAMKREKIDLNTIAKVTGLSLAVIKKL